MAKGSKRQRRLAAAGTGSDWRELARLAQALGQPAVDSPDLAEALSVLGKLIHTRALAITLSNGDSQRVIAAWGSPPNPLLSSALAKGEWQIHALGAQHKQYGRLWVRRGKWETSPDALRFLKAAEHLLTAALYAQILVQEERDKRALAETLEQVSQVLTSSLDIDQVLARILDQLARLVPYDSALVMLLQDGRLHLHAQRGFKRLARKGNLSDVTFIPEETAKIMEVLEGREPVMIDDIRQVSGWVWVPFSAHIRSWMGVPLRLHDRAIGLFSIDKAVPGFFTPRHGALAAAVAPHAAIAIENARLYQELVSADAQVRRLSAHVIQAQEAERQRIGRELHDHAGQAIVAMRAELQILARHLPDDSAVEAQLNKLDSILRATARDLRLLSHELRSHLLDELGLVSALEEQVLDVRERFGIRAELVTRGEIRRHPRTVELAAFRIAQEALTNVAQHAQASAIRVELVEGKGGLRVSIQDDGVGFAVESKRHGKTMGLIGMRERAAAANGAFSISSQRGRGTRIVVEFPAGPGKP